MMTTFEKMTLVGAMLDRMHANRERAERKWGEFYGAVKYHKKESRLSKYYLKLGEERIREIRDFAESCFN